MKTFQTYLSSDAGFSAGTSYHKRRAVAQFLAFYSSGMEGLVYQDLLVYIDYLRSLRRSAATINRHLIALGDYFDYLMSEGICRHNPAQGLRVRHGVQKSPSPLVSYSCLEQLFVVYDGSLPNRVLLSLYIYQGIKSSDLRHLEVSDIDLVGGKISFRGYGVGPGRTAGRELALVVPQILLFHEWLQRRSGARYLLDVPADLARLTRPFFRTMARLNPLVRNAHVLRRVVLAHWLKSEDLRVVQYKAGHVKVSSTESYQIGDMTALQEAVVQLHPLR